ncbi:MAG: imidazole glycerol phosphate synthase subunit HisH [Clostridia bacterium]
MGGALVVVDYGINNLGSVFNAFVKLGHETLLAESPDDLRGAAGIVLPGVGSFDRAAEALYSGGFTDALRAAMDEGTPLLGICLGMQLLCLGSDEGARNWPGFGVVRGRLRRLPGDAKVPHMGWNTVDTERSSPLFFGIPSGSHFYFVHSFFLDSEEDPEAVMATCHYGRSRVAAVVTRGNVLGTQFHPEKSGPVGLKFLDNFARGVDATRESGVWL